MTSILSWIRGLFSPKKTSQQTATTILKPTTSTTWNAATQAETANLWNSMRISVPDLFSYPVSQIQKNKGRYLSLVSSMPGNIPWSFVAIIHQLEAGGSWTKHLHNGDTLSYKTVNVPSQRPPWPKAAGSRAYTWEESAKDALTMKGKELHRVTDWSIPHQLWLLEAFNGFGYRKYHSMLSPYIWSGTNYYTSGKYTSDGKFSSSAVSKQAGAAGILHFLRV